MARRSMICFGDIGRVAAQLRVVGDYGPTMMENHLISMFVTAIADFPAHRSNTLAGNLGRRLSSYLSATKKLQPSQIYASLVLSAKLAMSYYACECSATPVPKSIRLRR